MRGGAADPRGIRDRGAFGDAGPVDQPRPRAVIRRIALPGRERRQDRGPRRGAHRMGLLQDLQAVRLGVGGHRGGVRGGQEPEPGEDHLGRLAGAGERRRLRHRNCHLLLGAPPWVSFPQPPRSGSNSTPSSILSNRRTKLRNIIQNKSRFSMSGYFIKCRISSRGRRCPVDSCQPSEGAAGRSRAVEAEVRGAGAEDVDVLLPGGLGRRDAEYSSLAMTCLRPVGD